MRVAFLVCHLAGTGHLVRTVALARAVRDLGGEPLVISGGRRLRHTDQSGLFVHQLPPLCVDGFDYATLRRLDGGPAQAAYLTERRRQIEEVLGDLRAEVLVTETFPLGRRRLAAEFEHAVAIARVANPDVNVVASVRDVPEPPSRPDRVAEAADRIETQYDAVLVHGDAGLIPLSETWDLPEPARSRVHYTGYIGPSETACGPRTPEVLVSVGGGVLGRRLLDLAARAARLSTRPWRLLTGGPDAAEQARALTEQGPETLIVGPPRPDYPALLAHAACSVSLAGYNTVMDLAACRTPAILVPFAEHGEREQTIRARALAGLPGLSVLSAETLTPEHLAEAVEAAASGPPRPPWPFARDGAERAAQHLLALAGDVYG